MTDAWPISLRDVLPVVPVPLLPGDPDVKLDLQQAFTSMYDVFGYDLDIDYSKPPEVPLRAQESLWAEQIVRERRP